MFLSILYLEIHGYKGICFKGMKGSYLVSVLV